MSKEQTVLQKAINAIRGTATEHQSKMKFARLIRKYQLEECSTAKPCECTD